MINLEDDKVEVNDILYQQRPAKKISLGLGVLLAAVALALATVLAALL